MRRFTALIAAMAVVHGISTAHAAFIVEADNVAVAGKANDHFTSLPPGTGFSLSVPSLAVGLAGNQSAFGNPANATGPDQYTFSYTPGPDVDNTVFAPLTSLGNSEFLADPDGAGALPPTFLTAPQLASGEVGGRSGFYNVYFTTPSSTNVNPAGSLFEITGNAGTISLNAVNLNDGGTGPDEIPAGTFTGGANHLWLKLATVRLTAGSTYTVRLTANAATFVSQRAHGVMWERVIPEPSSFVLVALACAGLCGVRRRLA